MNIAQRKLSPEGPQLSEIVAGTMTWGVWGSDYDAVTMADLIGHCVDLGITTFDHADIYGHYTTEEAFGTALKQHSSSVRSQIQLVTKCGIQLVTGNRPENRVAHYNSSKEHIIASAERSLRKLQTDYLDLLLIHRPDPLMDPTEIAAAFAELKAAGKVLHFGVSNFTTSQFDLLRSETELVTNQVECHPLHTAPLFDGTYDQCQAHSLRPMVWSPLGGNEYFKGEGTKVLRLRDKVREIGEKYGVDEDVILLAWCRKHPTNPVPVIGTTKKHRITRSLKALSIDLERQEWFEILEAGRGHEVA
ncbi:putative oxidoreductase [Lewinella marina]|uniref:Aldo/keto reductase n=1 Tax=Neolewinella marina TaxID=438751 RepID=A0A2G0CCJ7_9BACT|nr:aldo/keto reductase [Neolewinella marina]NJB87670.1 putative oxidoreductase [Neolewinella marina]PHK97647.1 aldo/keto reductase [Neolewinella marina]